MKYKVFLVTILAALFMTGCPMMKSGMQKYQDRLAQERATEHQDYVDNYDEKLKYAETLCEYNHPKADKIYNILYDIEITPRLFFSRIRCNDTARCYGGAYRTALRMTRDWPALIKPYFLTVKYEILQVRKNSMQELNRTYTQLLDLTKKYPGKEEKLVKEIRELIVKRFAKARLYAKALQRERERKMSMAKHKLLEKFYGIAGYADCEQAVTKWQKKGYKKVVWAPVEDEFGRFECEVWGIPPKCGKSSCKVR